MSLRVGALMMATGLTLGLVFGALFVVAGAFLVVCGGIVAAVGMESVLSQPGLEADVPSRPVDAGHGDVAA